MSFAQIQKNITQQIISFSKPIHQREAHILNEIGISSDLQEYHKLNLYSV